MTDFVPRHRRLGILSACGACILASVLVAPRARAAEQVRYAVIVGNNQGNTPGRGLHFAEQEVGKLSDILREWGDFEGMTVLRGSDRQQVELALRAARTKLIEAKAAGKPTLFLFYYSGHGDNEALELGGSRLPLRDLRTYLETLPADVRLAFVDACQSGALTGVKGGRRAPTYEVRLADPGTVRGMAIVTSSTASELSQESDDLQGSYFSHNIMAGLRGLADVSRDGQVTLSELYQYAFRRTLAGTAASLIGGQHPTYDYQMAGAGDVILTRTRPKDAQIAFPRESGITYTVFRKGEVAAELASSPEQDLYLAVPAGEYRVVRRALANVTARTLALGAGSSITVDPGSMMVVPGEENLRKKGGDDVGVVATAGWGRASRASALDEDAPNQVGVRAGAQSNVVPRAATALSFVGLSYQRAVAWTALRLRGEISSFTATQPFAEGANDVWSSSYLRVAPTLDAFLPLYGGRRLSLLVGPSVGVVGLRETTAYYNATASRDWNWGLSYGGALSFAVRVASAVRLVLDVNAGAEVIKLKALDDATTARRETHAVVGAAFGASYAF